MFNVITELMPHQNDAVNKMLPSLVGALFMDMGTGKSLTAIKLASLRKYQGKIDKVVWCCPVSLKINTQRQIITHTDAIFDEVHLFNSKTTDKKLKKTFWHVVGIESIGQSDRVTVALNALVDDRTMLIVDESSFIKGHRSKRANRLIEIGKKAKYRLILTGTPISQGIEDLYTQMTFLSDKILGYRSWYSFRRAHIEYSEKYKGKIEKRMNHDYLAMRIAPYVYQVKKEECITLPEKSSSSCYVDLTDEQRKYYDIAKEIFFEEITSCEEETPVAIYRLFGSLQSIVNGVMPSHYLEEGEAPKTLKNAKIGELLRVLRNVENKHVVIWVKYVASVHVLNEVIKKEYPETNISLYFGELNESEKNIELQRWRERGGLLVATQSSGGYGLTLVESAYSIFFSNSFKYSERIQAEDRLHRIGQVNPVHYVDIWCDCGIEDRIRKALIAKANALEYFQEEVERVRKLGSDAIKELLKSL